MRKCETCGKPMRIWCWKCTEKARQLDRYWRNPNTLKINLRKQRTEVVK